MQERCIGAGDKVLREGKEIISAGKAHWCGLQSPV